MGKMILVLDAPSACISCPLFNASGKCCGYWQHAANEEDIFEKRPDWCPLKELPDRMHVSEICSDDGEDGWSALVSFYSGWNHCLNAITGSGEEP